MLKLHTYNYRRPSLRFLQRDVDRKKEQIASRRSARLSKAFAMRNLDLPTETFVTEESAESSETRINPEDGQIQSLNPGTNAGVLKPPNRPEVVPNTVAKVTAHRKALVDMQKEKLQRWKDEQRRKKELEKPKKKPFLLATRLVFEMPKFLGSASFAQKDKSPSKAPKATPLASARTFTLRSRPQQSQNCAAPLSSIPRTNLDKENVGARGGKSRAPLMSSNLEKTASKDLFSADISRIKPEEVSFAPANFTFTGVPQLRRDVESTRRSSTPLKEVAPAPSGSGVSVKEVDLRRSCRLKAKSKEPTPVSGAGGTFVVPKTPKLDSLPLNRVSLLPLVRESTVGRAFEDDLIDL